MWRLDEKLAAGEALDEAEKSFYNSHLVDIAEYYAHNDEYWNNKKIII